MFLQSMLLDAASNEKQNGCYTKPDYGFCEQKSRSVKVKISLDQIFTVQQRLEPPWIPKSGPSAPVPPAVEYRVLDDEPKRIVTSADTCLASGIEQMPARPGGLGDMKRPRSSAYDFAAVPGAPEAETAAIAEF